MGSLGSSGFPEMESSTRSPSEGLAGLGYHAILVLLGLSLLKGIIAPLLEDSRVGWHMPDQSCRRAFIARQLKNLRSSLLEFLCLLLGSPILVDVLSP